MERFVIYLLQTALSLAIFHVIYRLFVRKETFHRLNRWTLLGSMLFSAVLPLISIPSIRRQTTGLMDGFSNLLLPVIVTADEPATSGAPASAPNIDFWHIAAWISLTVTAVLLIRLLIQLAGIMRLIVRSERISGDGYQLVISKKIQTPFSFFRYIFLNPGDLQHADSQRILPHEETHSRQVHSVDALLSELYTAVFWFNPVAWWHRTEILLNLEFLADQGALDEGGETEAYQFQLLKASLRDMPYALANHFAQSIVKKRIKMINTERSPSNKTWKYLMLIPAAALSLFLINCNSEMAPDKNSDLDVENDLEVEGIISETLATSDSTDGHRIWELRPENDEIIRYNFAEVDKKPEFPGGNDQIMNYVVEHINYPEKAKKAGIDGTVYVQFTITESGNISDALVARGEELGGGLAAEALRVVKNMPAWTPGENQGEKVAVSYTLPIFFRLGDAKSSGGSRDRNEDTPKDIYSFASVDKKPLFPGGNDKVMAYVGQNFKYPAEAREQNIQGTVYIQFTVEKDGSITDVKCVRGEALGGGLAEEGIRVVENMPKWTPGEHHGEKVRVSYTLPIFARIQKQNQRGSKNLPGGTHSLGEVDKKPAFPGGNDKTVISYTYMCSLPSEKTAAGAM